MDQLRSLRVFVTVVSEGSFAGAARVLGLAPGVVTRAVSDLEDHLGVRLLNRTTRRLALTDVGDDYLGRARRVLEDLDDADALAHSENKVPKGTLRILCPPAFATHQLVKYLPQFRDRYPGIYIELSASGPVAVADEGFDVSIVSVGLQPLQGDFVVRLLASSAFVICAAPSYLSRFGRPEQPEDLVKHQGLIPAVVGLRRELTLIHSTGDVSKHPSKVISLDQHRPLLATRQLEVLYAAALAGVGITGLPTFMVSDAVREGRLEQVLPHWTGGALQLYATMPTRKHVPARTRVFIDFLVEVFGGTQADPWVRTGQART